MRVVILGASPKPERYAHKALVALEKHHHEVYLVNPRYKEIDGKICFPSLGDVPNPVDTVTMYINPTDAAVYLDDLVRLKPRRVIFNPGTESANLKQQLERHGIETLEACTLVLLQTHQFSS